MNEQPKQSEIPEEDLFEWGEKHTKLKPEKDNLGWDCPQCELLGRECSRCVDKNPFEGSSLRHGEEVNKILQIEKHKSRLPKKISNEEAVEMLNQTLEQIRRQAS